MSKRRNFSPDFKAKVALETLRGELTLAELAKKHDLHPNMISLWKKQIAKGASVVFSGVSGGKNRDVEKEIHRLHAKIGELAVENDFLKKT